MKDDPICLFIHEDELRLNTTEGLLILIDQRLTKALKKIAEKDAREKHVDTPDGGIS